ncbi:MAG: hypothetical protein HC802_00650 [Caldilineaceae bacterium]|nr:hypothetical protein [Caldilineaceae bacterium]
MRALLRDLIADEPNPVVRGTALRVLAVLNPEDADELVAPFSHDQPDEVRRGALVGMLLTGETDVGRQAQADVTALAGSPAADDRLLAAQVIGDVGVLNLDELLLTLSEDEETDVQRAAVLAAGKSRRPELWQHVIEALGRPKVAGAAATALIAGGDSALPEIKLEFNAGAVHGDEQRVRLMRLAQVCGRIRGEQIVDLLKTKLNYPNVGVRTQIHHALSHCEYEASSGEVAKVDQQLRGECAEIAWLLAVELDVARQGGEDESGRLDLLTRALASAQGRGATAHFLLALVSLRPTGRSARTR